MRNAFRLVVLTVVALGLLTGTAFAQFSDSQDRILRTTKLFDSPLEATHSDFAFWGDHAVLGYYTATSGGVRIFDISNPASPDEIKNFPCNGNQNDPILWDRNGNGVADLMLLAVDRTMDSPDCDAAQSMQPNPDFDPSDPESPEFIRFDANPQGWEGVRVFELSDGSGDYRDGDPFEVIDQVDAQYTDCGAHTITANTKFANDASNPRLVVYVQSYPLRPGPTCGQTGMPAGQEPYKNVNNPFEESDVEVEDPLHRVIQVLNVPLDDPANTTEIAEPEISYQIPGFPRDPDGKQEWAEKGQPPPPEREPAAVACHDVVIHVPDNILGAACAEQGQVWPVDPDTLIPDTLHPMAVGDDEVSSGGTGQFPGAIDFFHSVMFDNGMETVNWVDESFGRGCPPMTTWQPRPWNPAGGTHKTGYMYFSDMEGNFQSRFHVGDRRPDISQGEYCSSHMGMTVTGIRRDLLVNAWYTGGMDVIDFTDPTRLREIAYYDPERVTGAWSAYPYTGPLLKGPGVPVYVSDGVEDNENARGLEVYRARVQKPAGPQLVDHLNPQTMED